jgi:hypothetical protein
MSVHQIILVTAGIVLCSCQVIGDIEEKEKKSLTHENQENAGGGNMAQDGGAGAAGAGEKTCRFGSPGSKFGHCNFAP